MKKKKVVVVVIIVLLLAAGITAAVLLLGDKKDAGSDEMVYVDSVANITGLGLTGDNRYMGVVESQETKGVDKASDKTVKEIFVEVGDEVKEGDPLFEYDSEEMTLKLKQLQLELTSINTSIATANQQIASLAAERDQVEADYKMEYTAQIQGLQAQINQYNYDASAKQLEIDRQKAAIDNSVVFAPMNGIIKEINKDANGNSQPDMYYGGDSQQKSFISIMALGDYRIKATASELNVRSMSEGQPIIIRSRMDDDVTWTGTITLIDLEHPDTSNNNNYYYDSSSTQASKYPFYIALDSIDGLMLGQHVYVELDYGQGAAKEGLWLGDYYLIQEDGNYYAWVENADGRIEKRRLEIGEYDESTSQVQILSGLSASDYIAWPEDRIREGMKATHNYEDVLQYENQGGEGMDDLGEETWGDPVYYDENGNPIEPDGMDIDGMDMNGMDASGSDALLDEDGNPIETMEEFSDPGEGASE